MFLTQNPLASLQKPRTTKGRRKLCHYYIVHFFLAAAPQQKVLAFAYEKRSVWVEIPGRPSDKRAGALDLLWLISAACGSPWDLRRCAPVPESPTSPGHRPDVASSPGAQVWRRLWGSPSPWPFGCACSFYSAHTHLHDQSLSWILGTAASLAHVSKERDHRLETGNPGWLGWGVFTLRLLIPDNGAPA